MWGGYFFAIAFFLLLFFAALTSTVSLLEVVVKYFEEEQQVSRKKAIVCVMIACGIVGTICSLSLGIWENITFASIFGFESGVKIFNLAVFDLLDYIATNILLPTVGLLTVIYVGWINTDTIIAELKGGDKGEFRLEKVFLFIIRYITPPVIFFILLNAAGIL